MAVSLLAREVSDLCLGKPALRSLSVSATIAEALSALKRSDDPFLSVWGCDHNNNKNSNCIDKVGLVDIISFMSKEEKLKNIGKALQEPLSSLLASKVSYGLVSHLEPYASLLEAVDLIAEGTQNLVIPIHSPCTRNKLIPKSSSNSAGLHNNREYCWLTQEDIIRYFLDSIVLFSPIPNQTVESLNIIDTESILAVCYDEPASAVLPLISQSIVKQTSVAILDLEGKLIGEISPYTLNSCDKSVAAAIATLSAGQLMAYIEYGNPPEDLIRLVKERLEDMNLSSAMELMEEESGISSYSSSSEEELRLRNNASFRGHSTRLSRKTDATVCFPWSSMVAVMIQAISHRVNHVWVVEEAGTLVGLVTVTRMIKVFRQHLKAMT